MRSRIHLRSVLLGFCAIAVSALLGTCAKPEETFATPEYTHWAKTTNVVLDYPIPGHENRFRIPRMNALGFSAVPKQSGGKLAWDFPEGTVIVKEVYANTKPAPGEKPIQLTIMAKRPRDPRSRGGWLWLTKSLPGGKETVFMGNFCVTCHASTNESHPYGDGNPNEDFRDYVFFVPGEGAPPKVKSSGY